MKVNPIIWTEIYVSDMARAKKFYEAVFGLKFEKLDSPVKEVELWAFPMEMDRVGSGGALAKMPGVKPGGAGVIPYFHCKEVSVELARVEKAGGKIERPKTSIGQYGAIAIILDTEGNAIGLHMPSKDMSH